MKNIINIIVIIIFILLVGGLFVYFILQNDETEIKQYTTNRITNEITNSTLQNTNTSEEYCINEETGGKMSLSEAISIANQSDCIEEGPLKKTSFCNEVTGTWWIELDIEKEGCNPACVVNVVTKESEINWRCTGVVPY